MRRKVNQTEKRILKRKRMATKNNPTARGWEIFERCCVFFIVVRQAKLMSDYLNAFHKCYYTETLWFWSVFGLRQSQRTSGSNLCCIINDSDLFSEHQISCLSPSTKKRQDTVVHRIVQCCKTSHDMIDSVRSWTLRSSANGYEVFIDYVLLVLKTWLWDLELWECGVRRVQWFQPTPSVVSITRIGSIPHRPGKPCCDR